jgi:PAS domain S-box-containing protein
MTSAYRDLAAQSKVLQYENNQLLQIFEHLDFGVLMVDAQDQIFFANQFCLSLTGKGRSELLNQPVSEALNPPALVEFIHRQNLVEMGNEGNRTEIKFPSAGPDKTFRVRAVPLIGHDQIQFGFLVYMEDITPEKAAEKASQDFMNHIAHELRTPLTNIKAYNEMMMDGEIVAPEMQKEFFHTINDETNRLSNLVKNILELAETEMGQLTARRERVETRWLHQSCLDAVEKVAREKQIELTSQLPDNMPSISGDKEMLKSALINVLGNAVKYTPRAGTIEFMIQDKGDAVIFQIADSGYGISGDDLPHIFEKFYRSENESVTDETGTGLGLAITWEIINHHGGHIEVDSQPSKGSTFTITIPKGDLTIG